MRESRKIRLQPPATMRPAQRSTDARRLMSDCLAAIVGDPFMAGWTVAATHKRSHLTLSRSAHIQNEGYQLRGTATSRGTAGASHAHHCQSTVAMPHANFAPNISAAPS